MPFNIGLANRLPSDGPRYDAEQDESLSWTDEMHQLFDWLINYYKALPEEDKRRHPIDELDPRYGLKISDEAANRMVAAFDAEAERLGIDLKTSLAVWNKWADDMYKARPHPEVDVLWRAIDDPDDLNEPQIIDPRNPPLGMPPL